MGKVKVTHNYEEIEARDEAIFNRNQLLKESDWTQLPDIDKQTQTAWKEYRQALRDITEQAGFPFNIKWPNQPKKVRKNK